MRHKNGLVKRVSCQVRDAIHFYEFHASCGERISGILRRGKFGWKVFPRKDGR